MNSWQVRNSFLFAFETLMALHCLTKEYLVITRLKYDMQALKAVVPGFEKAKLRNFGMTIGETSKKEIEFFS